MFKNNRQEKLTLQATLKKLGQPKSVYLELLSTDAENQAWVEQLIDTILQKSYLPA